MRILCLGGNVETAIALEGLILEGAPIVGVLSASEQLRPNISDFADITKLAEAHNIRCQPIEDVNAENAIEFAKQVAPTHLFVLGWSQLIKKRMLSIPKNATVGSHPAPLPSGRGRAPVPWTIIEDRKRSAVTLFEMTEQIDEGPILSMRWFDIGDRPYAQDLYDLVAYTLRDSFIDLVQQIQAATMQLANESELPGSIYAKRVPADGWIDFCQSADQIDRLVRAVSAPYPGAYSWMEGQKIIFHRCDPADPSDREYHGQTGQILRKRKSMVLVQCGDIPLWLGNRPKTPQWLDSFAKLKLGSRFGCRTEDMLNDVHRRLEQVEQELKLLKDSSCEH